MTGPGTPEWTVATLHAHMSMLFDERDKRYAQRFTDLETALRAALAASEKAIGKAEIANENRFRGVNEFRQTLSDQAAQFMTRTEAIALTERNTERIRDQGVRHQELADRFNRSEGRGTGITAGWGYLVGAVSLIAIIVGIVVAFA